MICDAYLYLKTSSLKSAQEFITFQRANYRKNPYYGAFHDEPKLMVVGDDAWLLFIINNYLVAYPVVKYLVKFFWYVSLLASFKLQKRLNGFLSYLGSGDVAKYYVDGGKEGFR